MRRNPTAVVSGDVVVDWNLALRRRQGAAERLWSAAGAVSLGRDPGGAALLGILVEQISKRAEAGRDNWVSRRQREPWLWSVRRVQVPEGTVDPGSSGLHHTFTLLDAWNGVWRVREFLGIERAGDDVVQPVPDNVDEADLVVLDDTDMGFRDARDAWPRAVHTPGQNPWVILKSCSPLGHGPLWSHLLEHHADRLILITTVDDLRRIEVQISRRLSWERTAQDLVWEVHRNPAIDFIGRCANSIVSFGTAGAVVFSRADASARLVFDPRVMEGEWESPKQGATIGNTTTLTAAVAYSVMLDGQSPDLTAAVERAIAGMRALYDNGYGPVNARPAFPANVIVDAMFSASSGFTTVPIRPPEERSTVPGGWTILDDQVRVDLQSVAEQIAVAGPDDVLRTVPQFRIGGLFTVDRREIESLRGIKRLLAEYNSRRPSKPLSIAVFGPPGSGKSFGVEQIAKSIAPNEFHVLPFNLSQFARAEDLHGALHQVRDVSLSGKLPIVFWDEFDTPLAGEPLGWLRYFLAPMQDGSFQEGQITHPIGTSVFVFTGGTSPDLRAFGQELSEGDRKSAKVPDFVSRLKGFLNVLGPNRRSPDSDRYFMLRRAILLRALLERHCPSLFDKGALQIDPGVLRAFLQTAVYKHGARSMEAIIAMSALAGKSRFERSSLPSETELTLHVNGRDFIALVHQMQLTKELVEALAEAAHALFREGKERDGWVYGAVKDENKRTHPFLVPYADLPENIKETNRGMVRNIPKTLAAAGYVMTPARSGGPPAILSAEEIEFLAEIEHEQWTAGKLAEGFTLGPSDQPNRNEYLVPWSQVPQTIKQIDRDLAAGIVKILSRAGYTIVKLSED